MDSSQRIKFTKKLQTLVNSPEAERILRDLYCTAGSVAQSTYPNSRPSTAKRVIVYLLKPPAMFALGAIASLLFQRLFVEFIPGPKIAAEVRALPSGMVPNCTVYSIAFTTDEPIDFASGQIEFPNRVADYKFGYLQGAIDPAHQRLGSIIAGINPNGTCKFDQGVSAVDSTGIQSSAAGNVFAFSINKMSNHQIADGFILTQNGKSDIFPVPAFYSEGTYEYTKLGQPIRKPFSVQNLGMKNGVPQPGERP